MLQLPGSALLAQPIERQLVRVSNPILSRV